MKKETRSTVGNVELRSDEGSDLPAIEGYAARWYDENDPGTEYRLWDNCQERITRGAFDESLKNGDIRGCFNHSENFLLGRTKSGTMKVWADDKGLRFRIKPSDTTAYRDTLELIRRGDVDGASFQFAVPKGGDEWRNEGTQQIRYLRKVELYELGPVVWPAYTSTSSGVRTAEDALEARKAHDEWQASVKAERDACDKRLREIRLKDLADS